MVPSGRVGKHQALPDNEPGRKAGFIVPRPGVDTSGYGITSAGITTHHPGSSHVVMPLHVGSWTVFFTHDDRAW